MKTGAARGVEGGQEGAEGGPLKAAFNGIVVSYVLSFLNKETRLTPVRLKEAFEVLHETRWVM